MMGLEQKKAYLETTQKRYKKSTKKQKKKIGRSGRKPRYDTLNLMKLLKAIRLSTEQKYIPAILQNNGL